jgi:hypothetical protein
MLESKTHFEQVPLETVRRIVEDQVQRETTIGEGIKKETLEKGLAGAEEQSMVDLANCRTGEL